MAGLDWDVADAFVDNRANRFVNDIVPGNGMYLLFE